MGNCRLAAVLSLMATAMLGGCGTTYSLKTFSPNDSGPRSAFIDIKQRAILAANRPGTQGAGQVPETVICAEPSPDSMSSFASELALDAKHKDALQATLGWAQQEAASFVGLRTQTIQLLRDGMYRLCEGYMSGALSASDYAWLSRRYQKNMVALLTIEQLTRVAQVPVISHASQGMASASRSATAIQADLADLRRARASLDEQKATLDKELSDAQKLPDTDAAKVPRLATINQRLKDNQEEIKENVEVRAALLKGLEAAKGVLASGSTSVQIVTPATIEQQANRSDTVATLIAALTKSVLETDDLPTLCFQLITGGRAIAAGATSQKLIDSCTDLVAKQVAHRSTGGLGFLNKEFELERFRQPNFVPLDEAPVFETEPPTPEKLRPPANRPKK